MFNGIVETVGEIIDLILENDNLQLTIKPAATFLNIELGESIAINGTCLTVCEHTNGTFKVTVVPETLRLTNLGQLKKGKFVNLERALLANSRISGHFVQGHVDGTGKIISINNDGKSAILVKIKPAAELLKYIVKKGYIGIDGMSITVADTHDTTFDITLIPFTRSITIAKDYKVNDLLNIEVDILGKYLEKLFKETHYEHHSS